MFGKQVEGQALVWACLQNCIFSLSMVFRHELICIQLFRERLSGKVHATILKGIVGGFEFSFFSKKFERIGTKGHGNVFVSAT